MRSASIISGASLCKGLLAVAILLGGGAVTLRAQEASRTVDQTFQFDERGDAKIEFNFQLSRLQWNRWKAQYGDHPDVLLRLTKYNMAAAAIDNFSLTKDDTQRSAVTRFTARALAQYRGNGQFEIPMPRNVKPVTGSGLDWVFTSSAPESNVSEGQSIVNTTIRAKLPAKAHDARMVYGNDSNRLVYSLEVSPSKPRTLLYSGVILIVAALVVAVRATRADETTSTKPPLDPSRPAPTARPPRSS
jgi:hypothetical protein